jgi:hypothetical protein
LEDDSNGIQRYCEGREIVVEFHDNLADDPVEMRYVCEYVTPETCEYLYDSAYGFRGDDDSENVSLDMSDVEFLVDGTNGRMSLSEDGLKIKITGITESEEFLTITFEADSLFQNL